jgi:hypothetical protein
MYRFISPGRVGLGIRVRRVEGGVELMGKLVPDLYCFLSSHSNELTTW